MNALCRLRQRGVFDRDIELLLRERDALNAMRLAHRRLQKAYEQKENYPGNAKLEAAHARAVDAYTCALAAHNNASAALLKRTVEALDFHEDMHNAGGYER